MPHFIFWLLLPSMLVIAWLFWRAAHKQVQQLTTENAALKKQIADAEKAKKPEKK